MYWEGVSFPVFFCAVKLCVAIIALAVCALVKYLSGVGKILIDVFVTAL